MNFLEKLDFLIEKREINKHKLSALSNIPYTTIDGFYKKGYSNMKLSNFKAICDYFGVTMDSMAYDDKEIEYISNIGKHTKLSPAEKELLTNFGELDEIGKGRLLERSKSLIDDGYADERINTDKKKTEPRVG